MRLLNPEVSVELCAMLTQFVLFLKTLEHVRVFLFWAYFQTWAAPYSTFYLSLVEVGSVCFDLLKRQGIHPPAPLPACLPSAGVSPTARSGRSYMRSLKLHLDLALGSRDPGT